MHSHSPNDVTPSAVSYTDGGDVERRLLDCLRSCRDVSSFSPELRASITDWPSEYHFSCTRHNLLHALDFAPGMRVLELGCGCGAMTRFLGETGAEVVAVEGSTQRAAIARERCRDLPNVHIYCSNLIDYVAEQHFDYVLLIGVLEYAPCYIRAPDPVKACLEYAAGLLTESGTLILAIENQLGLKYFNGCNEDHLGKPFYGIHGLYDRGEPKTFGREALIRLLSAAGFVNKELFYPFPDYKLPTVVIADAALSHPNFKVSSLLCRIVADNRHGSFTPSFLDNLAWPAIAENGLFGDLANSFLVLANKGGGKSRSWLACTYATDRLPAFATESRMDVENGHIKVNKRVLTNHVVSPSSSMPQGELQHMTAVGASYVVGEIYLMQLQRILGRGGGLDDLCAWAEPWINHLIGLAQDDNGTWVLDGNLLDAIPGNFVQKDDGTLVMIDHEWLVTAPVPLSWVLIRGLINSVAASPTSTRLASLTHRQVISHIVGRAMKQSGVQMDDLLIAANCYENALRETVFGKQFSPNLITKILDQPATSLPKIETLRDLQRRQEQELVRLRSEVARVKSTLSWQITKPVRLLANLPGYLAGMLHLSRRKK